MIWTKGAHQGAKFQTSNCSREISRNLYFDMLLLLKVCTQFQLRKDRGIISYDTEEWFKIWRNTNLLFQKWQEFVEFWSEHSKVSKICTLIGPFRAKYITFDLKKYRGVILKSHAKFEEKLACGPENGMRNLANFY